MLIFRSMKPVKKTLSKAIGKQQQFFCYHYIDMKLKNVGEAQDGWNVLNMDNEMKRLKVRLLELPKKFVLDQVLTLHR